ncbi:MAG: toxin-antitoxin system protein [Bacteroidales bacterium]|nr:toxin-antitoxin system protein [Bacteroidales bacterium]
MKTTVEKRQAAFRLNANLLDRLKVEARKTNRSLSNYVECILMESVYGEPNETTLDAIKEARSGQFAGTIDTSSLEAFMKSCGE